MTHDEKKDWEFFRKTAQKSSGRTSSRSIAQELKGIVEARRRTA